MDDCWSCRAGYYCDLLGMIGFIDFCFSRYYCLDIVKIELDSFFIYLCLVGFYCFRGIVDFIGCDLGNDKFSSYMRYKKK